MKSDIPWMVEQLGLFPSAILAVTVATVFIYWLLNNSSLSGWFKGSEDIVPPYISISALLFGLFAATLAADIWPKHEEANKMLIKETSAVRSLMASAEHLDQADREKLLHSVNAYVTAVLEKEWPAMQVSDADRREDAVNEIKVLSETTIRIAINGNLPKIVENRLQNSIDEIRTARLSRLSLAHDSVTFIKWRAVFWFGLLLLFTVGIVHLRRPRAMKITLTVTAVGILLTIGILVNNRSPYAGKGAIDPEMLSESIKLYDKKLLQHPTTERN